jgi:hypothetical protein
LKPLRVSFLFLTLKKEILFSFASAFFLLVALLLAKSAYFWGFSVIGIERAKSSSV